MRDIISEMYIRKGHHLWEAIKKLEFQSYDVVILDIVGVRGFDLLELAVNRNMKAVMLTAHALNPRALKRSFDMKARAYLPKEKMSGIVTFLEDVLSYEYLPGWRRLVGILKTFFDAKFNPGWGKEAGLRWPSSIMSFSGKISYDYRNAHLWE